MRRRVLIALLVVTVAAAALVGVGRWRDAHRPDFEKALDLLPADTLRASWTDWAGVRQNLGVGVPTAPDDIRGFMERAFSSDLSGASGIDESAVAMATNFGFSPADLDWEMFGQSREGAVLLLKLPDSASTDEVASRLAGLGYVRPTRSDGVWEGGPDVVASIDPTISPEMQFISVLADQRLVLASDTSGYLETAVAAANGKAALGSDALNGLAGEADEPLAAIAFVNDFACEALAMSQADSEQQAAASQLIQSAGGINPVTGLLVAAYADRRLRVALAFENDDQARRNAGSRAQLASGAAPGQGEDFPDLFAVTSGTRDGASVVLNLHAKPDSYVLSNLTSGPVLFESC